MRHKVYQHFALVSQRLVAQSNADSEHKFPGWVIGVNAAQVVSVFCADLPGNLLQRQFFICKDKFSPIT